MDKSAFEDENSMQVDQYSKIEPCHDKTKEYRFQQALACHEASVRAIATHPEGEVMMSGSID